MEDYQRDFMDFLVEKGALRFGKFELKSGRVSPYFIDMGELLKDGECLSRLGEFYTLGIQGKVGFDNFDVLYGPPEKGKPLSAAVASAMFDIYGMNKKAVYKREIPKYHGEGTAGGLQDIWLYGATLKGDEALLLLDDVFTTGRTKYQSIDFFSGVSPGLKCAGVFIGVDRQEVGERFESAAEEFTKEAGVPVDSIITASGIYEYADGKPLLRRESSDLFAYIMQYGTDEAKKSVLDGRRRRLPEGN
jgi:orotate phosphoribosyltransferase